jgi:hypothetical protein
VPFSGALRPRAYGTVALGAVLVIFASDVADFAIALIHSALLNHVLHYHVVTYLVSLAHRQKRKGLLLLLEENVTTGNSTVSELLL